MSNLISGLAWETPNLPQQTKFVLIKLADNASDEGYCWPSYDTISRHCCMSRRTVMRHIGKLVDLGLVSKHARFRKSDIGCGQTSNGYLINIKQLKAEIKKFELEKASQVIDKFGVTPMTLGGDTHDTGGGDTGDTHNHQYEPSVNKEPLTPIQGNERALDKLTKTQDPHSRSYKLNPQDEELILSVWNEQAENRFSTKTIFDQSSQRSLSKTYGSYKKQHNAGHYNGAAKTKVEFAITLIGAFNKWVDSSRSPEFYLKPQDGKVKTNAWIATLEYALRLKTYEKIINNEY